MDEFPLQLALQRWATQEPRPPGEAQEHVRVLVLGVVARLLLVGEVEGAREVGVLDVAVRQQQVAVSGRRRGVGVRRAQPSRAQGGGSLSQRRGAP